MKNNYNFFPTVFVPLKGMIIKMEKIKKGDIVGRISYGKDIIFSVSRIINQKNGGKIALLKGITQRIEADSSIDDLYLIQKKYAEEELKRLDTKIDEKVSNKERKNSNTKKIEKFNRFYPNDITGKILHLDGDSKYSEKSFKYYKKMGLYAIVKNIPEYKQPRVVYRLLEFYKPDILVITGHDGLIKKDTGYDDIYNYRNSKYFIETVKQARLYEKNTNSNIAIFAGACQSYFEALIMAGANFASSPARILIDILDPLIVAEKIATSDRYTHITIDDIETELRDGKRGVGGIGANRKKTSFKIIRKNLV